MTLTVGYLHEGNKLNSFSNPDAALIEEQVRAIDWQDSERPGFIRLLRPGEKGPSYLNVQGTLAAPNTGDEFKAMVVLRNADGSPWGVAESPLESVDAAVELLLSFHNDVEKLKSVARQWEGEFPQ